MTMLKYIDSIFDRFSKYYIYLINTTHLLNFGYLILFMGFNIILVNQSYLRTFNTIIQLLVCLFIMLRFNPRRNINVLKDNDKSIIFGSAVFLFVNLGVIEYLNRKIEIILPSMI